MKIEHIDQKAFPPTLFGAHGAAWEVDLPKARALAGETEDSDSTVALWIVYAPWANAFWSYYLIGGIHLRRSNALSTPKIMLPGATHEVLVFALDPEAVPDTVDTYKIRKLTPANFVGQWRVAVRPNPVDLDNGAAAKIRVTVEEILAGVLSPDSDYVHAWVKRFSASNLKGGR